MRIAEYVGRSREALDNRVNDVLQPLLLQALDHLPEEARPAFGLALQRVIDRDVEEQLADAFADGLDVASKASYVLYFLSVTEARDWVRSVGPDRLASFLQLDPTELADYAAGGGSLGVETALIARGTSVEEVRGEIAVRLSRAAGERGLGDSATVMGRAFTLFVERLLPDGEKEM